MWLRSIQKPIKILKIMSNKLPKFPNGLQKTFVANKNSVTELYVETSSNEMKEKYNHLLKFKLKKSKDVQWRKDQAKKLLNGLLEMQQEMVDCAVKDFKTSSDVAVEIAASIVEITLGLENIDKWSSKEYVSKGIAYAIDDAYILKEPYGLVLIISPWNFPYRLCLLPLIGAILAGNSCILKPSELSPNSSMCIKKIVDKYLDPDCFSVVNGGPEISSKLLELRFDYIFYTGGTFVGKIVQTAAAKNLTPTTLELGGKNPVFVDGKTTDLKLVARRIAFGKWMNAGQICLSPEYVICAPKYTDKLIGYLIESIEAFYTTNPQEYDNYTKIVNKKHAERIINLLPGSSSEGSVVYGGKHDLENRYISPTILKVADKHNSKVMKEESFSPILSIIEIESLDEAVEFVKSVEIPLALYIFSNDNEYINKCIDNIPSGGVSINDTLMHSQLYTLPFGGLGNSGMGSYNGKFTFDCFTHKRAILKRSNLEFINAVRYEPLDLPIGIPLMLPQVLYPFLPTSKFSRFFNRLSLVFSYLWGFNKFIFAYISGKYKRRMS